MTTKKKLKVYPPNDGIIRFDNANIAFGVCKRIIYRLALLPVEDNAHPNSINLNSNAANTDTIEDDQNSKPKGERIRLSSNKILITMLNDNVGEPTHSNRFSILNTEETAPPRRSFKPPLVYLREPCCGNVVL